MHAALSHHTGLAQTSLYKEMHAQWVFFFKNMWISSCSTPVVGDDPMLTVELPLSLEHLFLGRNSKCPSVPGTK